MNKKGSERRVFPRRLIKTKVVFEDEFGEGLICLDAVDISLGGVFLNADIPMKTGSYVFLSFYLPETKIEIRATGQVARVVRSDEGASNEKEGVGVRFVGLSNESVQAIQEYIS